MIPQTEQALLEKAQSIAGLTFGELADELNIPVPPDLKRFLLKLENIPYIDKGVEYVKPKLLKKYHA